MGIFFKYNMDIVLQQRLILPNILMYKALHTKKDLTKAVCETLLFICPDNRPNGVVIKSISLSEAGPGLDSREKSEFAII